MYARFARRIWKCVRAAACALPVTVLLARAELLFTWRDGNAREAAMRESVHASVVSIHMRVCACVGEVTDGIVTHNTGCGACTNTQVQHT